jgi:hypothetical protein
MTTIQQSPPTFATEDLAFAAFLHSSRALRFSSCEPTGDSRVAFLFADPNNDGDKLQLEFESGAECPAAAFYDSIKHLRKVMDRARSKSRSTDQHEHHARPLR